MDEIFDIMAIQIMLSEIAYFDIIRSQAPFIK